MDRRSQLIGSEIQKDPNRACSLIVTYFGQFFLSALLIRDRRRYALKVLLFLLKKINGFSDVTSLTKTTVYSNQINGGSSKFFEAKNFEFLKFIPTYSDNSILNRNQLTR